MESAVWSMDWNPEFEGENRLKQEILGALQDERVIATIKHFAERAAQEAQELGLETEHIVWLDSSFAYAFFVRVWYDPSETKLFIIVEENDLGDVGFLLINNLQCARYNETEALKVELVDPDGVDPKDLGVSR
ncbi:MAG: hypothetical protein ACYDDF_00090 [Thermoplasmatota archaeon]